MKYYKVTCSRGHCGAGKNATISFYICAANALEAAQHARTMPGVKHSKSVLSCISIDQLEYTEGRKISAYERN